MTESIELPPTDSLETIEKEVRVLYHSQEHWDA